MDTTQTVLITVAVTLTILLVIVGLQVILVILDMRRALKRLNSILDDSIIGGGLIRPEKLTGIVEMFRKKKKLHESEMGMRQE